jgi:hypothetical protein
MASKDKVTVRNIGNTVIDAGVYGTNFVSGANSIPVGNIDYAFSTAFTSASVLSTASQLNNINLPANSMKELSFRIHSPLNTPAGSYVGRISVVAVASE